MSVPAIKVEKRSRWLDWQPKAPTTDRKPGSVGFEGSTPVRNSIIGVLEKNEALPQANVVSSSEIIEKVAQGEPTKPTELGFVGYEGLGSSIFSITSEQGSGPYAERVHAALGEINRADYPAGMVSWLEEAHEELYEDLISRIPREIDRCWNESAPFEEFEGLLDRWVSIHREGCRLYREEQAVLALTRGYSPEKDAANEDEQPGQDPAFKNFPTPEGCEISERSEFAEDLIATRSNPEKSR